VLDGLTKNSPHHFLSPFLALRPPGIMLLALSTTSD
jgi:hypothetical protein